MGTVSWLFKYIQSSIFLTFWKYKWYNNLNKFVNVFIYFKMRFYFLVPYSEFGGIPLTFSLFCRHWRTMPLLLSPERQEKGKPKYLHSHFLQQNPKMSQSHQQNDTLPRKKAHSWLGRQCDFPLVAFLCSSEIWFPLVLTHNLPPKL